MGYRWSLDLGDGWKVEKGGGEQIPRVGPLSLKRKIMCGSLTDPVFF